MCKKDGRQRNALVFKGYLGLWVAADYQQAYRFEVCINQTKGNFMKLITTLITIALGATAALAHPGGLDSNRCHTDHKTGLYHCH